MKQIITRSNKAPQVTTWAAFPGPALAPIGFYFISDFGIGGSLWYNNGATLAPVNRIPFFEDNTGFIIPALITANAATYSQTGNTVTVTSTGHNIPATINNGKNVALNIGTVSTGVAPVGYATGWFTNFQYVDANTFTCQATNSQSGTGAVNTNTAATVLPVSYTLPAGVMGTTGRIESQAITNHNNSAGAKTFRQLFGGNSWSVTGPTTTVSSYIVKSLKNKGAANIQVCPVSSLFTGGASSSANGVFAVNTANTVVLAFNAQCAAASDYAAIDYISLALFSN